MTVVSMLVVVLRSATMAPGIAARAGSVTVPFTPPAADCPYRKAAAQSASSDASRIVPGFLFISTASLNPGLTKRALTRHGVKISLLTAPVKRPQPLQLSINEAALH